MSGLFLTLALYYVIYRDCRLTGLQDDSTIKLIVNDNCSWTDGCLDTRISVDNLVLS